MGASSTTGVGQGSAFPGQNGPGNERNVFRTNNQAHLVGTGFVDGPGGIASGIIVVTFAEPLEGSESTYFVVLHRESGSSGADTIVPTDKTDNADGNFESFSATIIGNTDYRMFIYRNLPTVNVVITGPF